MCKYSPSNSNTEVTAEIEFTAEVDADIELAVGTEVPLKLVIPICHNLCVYIPLQPAILKFLLK